MGNRYVGIHFGFIRLSKNHRDTGDQGGVNFE